MPGSGKSALASKHLQAPGPLASKQATVLTLDGVAGAEAAERSQDMFAAAAKVLVSGGNVVADVTAVRAEDRAAWLALARRHDAGTTAVVMSTPVSVCVARNRQRPPHRRVPDDRMAFYAGMHQALERMVRREPWDEVVVIDGN